MVTPELQQVIAAEVEKRVMEIFSGRANLYQIAPPDLVYRGRGVYYSASKGWFAKGPAGTLLQLPGPPP